MSNLIPIREAKAAGTLRFGAKDLSIIKTNACPAYINEGEFNRFIHICERVGLNPLLNQIYCFVFNPDKPDKRRMTPVTSIHGLTAVAKRSGCYRPWNEFTIFDTCEPNKKDNPKGLVSAKTGIYLFEQGEWHFVPGQADWEEYAPIKTKQWDNQQRKLVDCESHLDPTKDMWRKMPKVMLEKCALARAIRRAFPEDCSDLFSEDEMAQANIIDLTPNEIVEARESAKRQALLGGPSLLVDWLDDNNTLESVPVKDFHGKFKDFISKHWSEEPRTIMVWKERNREALRQFWGHKKEEALSIKRDLEEIEKSLQQKSEQEPVEAA